MKKKPDVLVYLVELYKDLYTHKDLFKIDFKYSPKEVECLYDEIQNATNTKDKNSKKQEKKETIGDDILALKTSDNVKEYISKYSLNNNLSRDELLKKLNMREFAYLYNIIYSSQLKSNMRKIDALNSIEKYFYGISRAISIKP